MDYYDSISQGYDELYSDEQHEKIGIIIKLFQINKDSKMLDLGCGTGIASELSHNYIGIDSSAQLVEIAKHRYQDDKDKRFIVGKAEDLAKLGYKDKEFDIVISLSAIHHFSTPEKLFPEIRRIGKIFIVTILRKSAAHDSILLKIRRFFKVLSMDSSSKDTIVICNCS